MEPDRIIGEFQFDSRNILVLENPEGIVPTGLNKAIRIAKGEILIRVDGHTIIDSDYVRQCVVELRREGVDNVGGKMVPISNNRFSHAVALATSSPFGVGGAEIPLF